MSLSSPNQVPIHRQADFSYYRGEKAEARDLCVMILGRPLLEYELVGLCGAPRESNIYAGVLQKSVQIEYYSEKPLGIIGACRLMHDEKPALWNDSIRILRKHDRHQGVGLACFVRQVFWGQRLGIDRIYVHAGRHDGENGYYTWPRFGFEAILPVSSSIRSLLDLMSTPEGRRWWLQHGTARDMMFDLHYRSRSMRVFRNYIHEKLRHLEPIRWDRVRCHA